MARASVALLAALAVLVVVAPPAAAEPVEVQVGLLLINVGSYDVARGTYIADFYLWFRWDANATDEEFTPNGFEFMNGRATSRERIFDGVDATSGLRETFWRIQASLYSNPDFRRFPYDQQTIRVAIEDSLHPVEALVYVPLRAGTGLDEDVRVAGWRILDDEITTDVKVYPFEETYSRFEFSMQIAREPLSTTLKTFLPLVAFMFVSGLSFLFHPSKVANRVGLGTGMLISSVMFHVSQTVSLPPLGTLILFDKIMISVYAFMAGSLIVTTLIVIDQDYWKEKDHSKKINLYGAFATLALPLVVFTLLVTLF